MYKVLIRPVLTYASETQTVPKTNEWRVALFGRKALGCIFGAKQKTQHGEKDTTMNYTKHLMNQTLSNYIKVKRLAWAAHWMYMDSDRTVTKIFNTKQDGVRRRPKLGWEGVGQDMRILEV
jgi:hypothetical protein